MRTFTSSAILLFLLSVSSYAMDKKVKVYDVGLTLKNIKSILVVENENSQSIAPSLGMTIKPGYQVKTGPDSSALLVSEQGDTYQLEENSTLLLSLPLSEKLKRLNASQPSQPSSQTTKASTMEFLKGRIQAHVKPGQAEQVEIKTSQSVLSIKGTTFLVSIEKESVTLDVLDGTVEMKSNLGNFIQVAAGMRADTRTWQPMPLPKAQIEKMKSNQDKTTNPQNPPPPPRNDSNIKGPGDQNPNTNPSSNHPAPPKREAFLDKDIDLISPHQLRDQPPRERHDPELHNNAPLHDPSRRRNENNVKIQVKPPSPPTN